MRAMHRIVCSVTLIFLPLLAPSLLKAQQQSFELSKGKAGSVAIGMSIDDLYQLVGKQNTNLLDAFAEGYFSPVLEIRRSGAAVEGPALTVEVLGACSASTAAPRVSHGFVVGRISVKDPQFKTNLGIGVGSTLGEIRRWYKVDWIMFGEGPLVARVEEIGMTFALDYAHPPEAWFTTHDAALIPDNARVTTILLTLPPAETPLQPQHSN